MITDKMIEQFSEVKDHDLISSYFPGMTEEECKRILGDTNAEKDQREFQLLQEAQKGSSGKAKDL